MRHAFRFEWAGGVALAGVLLLAAVAAGADSAPRYRLAHQVSLPGDEGWDYLTLEPEGHRLFIAHGTHVLVVDTGRLAVAGRIADTPGVHGIALAPELNRGYVSAGRAGLVVVFDLKTLARLKEIKTTGENPDAIVYDAATRHVFTFNGRGRNVTAIDAGTDQVVGTLALDARPEFAVPDGRGRVYVNLEDRNSLAVLDARKLSVLSVWPIAGCEEPSGLAFDADRRHLFPVCSTRVMAVVEAASGHALGSAPIGAGVDAAAYDPGSGLAFASCGEGNLTVVRTGASGAPQVVQSVPTRRGARTMALDTRTHRVYLVTADFGPPPRPAPSSPVRGRRSSGARSACWCSSRSRSPPRARGAGGAHEPPSARSAHGAPDRGTGGAGAAGRRSRRRGSRPGGQRARSRDPEAAGRNQHHRLRRQRHHRRRSDGAALPGRGLPRRRHRGARFQRAQEEPGGAAPWHSQAQAGAAHRPPRRRRGAARGLEHRSLQAHREGRLLLRPRHAGYEGWRCHHGDDAAADEARGFSPESRHHSCAHGGRGGRLLQRRRLAHPESQGAHRCPVRAEPRRTLGP